MPYPENLVPDSGSRKNEHGFHRGIMRHIASQILGPIGAEQLASTAYRAGGNTQRHFRFEREYDTRASPGRH